MTGVEQRVFDALTVREKWIVHELMRGAPTNEDIARELGTTEKAVETHFVRILQKSGRRSRAELALFLAACPNLKRAIDKAVKGEDDADQLPAR